MFAQKLCFTTFFDVDRLLMDISVSVYIDETKIGTDILLL